GADHDVAVAGGRPPGHPAAVQVLLDDAVEQVGRTAGGEQVVGGPTGPEGVPVAVVDVQPAGTDAGPGLVPLVAGDRRLEGGGVDPGGLLAGDGGVLVVLVGPGVQPGKVRVGAHPLVVGAAGDLEAAQQVRPRRPGGVD